jgi:hypothetical protein
MTVPREEFDIWRGTCSYRDGKILINQRLRFVQYPIPWIFSVVMTVAGIYSYFSGWTYVSQTTYGETRYGWQILLVFGLTVPALRGLNLITGRLRSYTSETEIPLEDLKKVEIQMEPRLWWLRTTKTTPVFVLVYGSGNKTKKRRVRLDVRDRQRQVTDGYRFFENLGFEANEESFWTERDICKIKDGEILFEDTVDPTGGLKKGLFLTIVPTFLGATKLLFGIEWSLVITGVISETPLLRRPYEVEDTLVALLSLGFIWGLLEVLSEVGKIKSVPIDGITSFEIYEDSYGEPDIKIFFEENGKKKYVTKDIPGRDVLGEIDGFDKAKEILDKNGIEYSVDPS